MFLFALPNNLFDSSSISQLFYYTTFEELPIYGQLFAQLRSGLYDPILDKLNLHNLDVFNAVLPGLESKVGFYDLLHLSTTPPLTPNFDKYLPIDFISQPEKTNWSFKDAGMLDEFQYIDVEIRRRQIKYPHLTHEEVWATMTSLGSDGLEMALRVLDDSDKMPIDYSNLYEYKGKVVDVKTLSTYEIIQLAKEVDDIDKFEALEHIRSLYVGTSPNVKLYYPEPFLASPSFIHNDLGFLHILQYQFWLWFVFIFLIVFYFVSFLCVVRWCSNRNQPRRETRGVSRSKCGDLITATVPVTWAISIIVSESTDATDYYDGFSTGELIVGVRAYQWGWEYYYPKNVDLSYNVKPNYASYVGNSLRYNTATEKTLNSNDVWKFYQHKVDDAVITPAHLLVLPVDNAKILNFMNFDNIGANPLKASNAFKRIRSHSKVYTTNLVHTPSVFTDKYVKLNSLFVNENDLNNSSNYGLKRQHNLTSIAATTSINSTFLDRNSMSKFLNYNLQYNTDNNKTDLFNQDLDLWTKGDKSSTVISSINVLNLLLEDASTYNSSTLRLLNTYPNLVKEIGDDSDKKTSRYPIRKLLNPNLLRNNLVNDQNLLNTLTNVFTPSNVSSFIQTSLDNPSTTSKDFMLNSFNQGVSPTERSVRQYSKLTSTGVNYNLSLGLNSLDSNTFKLNLNEATTSPLFYSSLSKGNWNDLTVFNKLASNRFSFDLTHSPIHTNNPLQKSINYDATKSTFTKTITSPNKVTKKIYHDRGKAVQLLSGKRDNSLSQLTSSYWRMFWANTNPDLRITSALKSSLDNEFFYLPPFTNYDEYDFRNAQALEMLEDLFWEVSYSSYNHLEYLTINDNLLKSYDPFALRYRFERHYYLANLEASVPKRMFMDAALKDLSLVGSYYSNNIQLDDFFTPAHLTSTKDFSIIPLISNSTLIDDSYINQKHLHNLFTTKSSISLNFNTLFNYPQSYLSVLNNFRGDFDDFNWYVDLATPSTDLNTLSGGTVLMGELLEGSDISNVNLSRFSNPITLRSTAKNSITTYNAYQKVFKARFDEGRSNTRSTNFADLRVTQPFMNESRVPFEKLLGKNKENFYNTTFYTNNNFDVFNDLAGANSSLNCYFFDFPFLMSLMSDPSRFLWFDWYVRWGLIEVQPASASKLSVAGVPYTKKHFDFTIGQGEEMGAIEGYFTRLSRARKSYLPLWVYTPYMYTRSNIWSPESRLLVLNPTQGGSLYRTYKVLHSMGWYWDDHTFTSNTTEYFTPTFSNSHKSTWRPYSSIQSYYYTLSVLTDLLTHREYLYRQYLERTNKIIRLPKLLTANPQNPLITELRASFLLIDPITYNSEYSREFYYNSLTYFKFLIFKDLIIDINSRVKGLPINTNLINEYLFFYFLNTTETPKVGNNADLYKSQFRPLKKGITNMLRLHGTGAVAMPIEIRLQILASSRDVIHSWSIPSAGIKIDCIPGYTSHRIMIFFAPGIYWGQCMEICGRYHHWMPIIVYFMKRDLFFLWCTHFQSTSDFSNMWGINDRQFTDYIRFASYDRTTWLTELTKKL